MSELKETLEGCGEGALWSWLSVRISVGGGGAGGGGGMGEGGMVVGLEEEGDGGK